MTIYSTRLYGPAVVGAADVSLFTVPAAQVAVVRDIEWRAGATTTLIVAIGTTATAANRVRTITTGTDGQWQGRLVLNAGESLHAVSSGGGASTGVTVSGYLLDV